MDRCGREGARCLDERRGRISRGGRICMRGRMSEVDRVLISRRPVVLGERRASGMVEEHGAWWRKAVVRGSRLQHGGET